MNTGPDTHVTTVPAVFTVPIPAPEHTVTVVPGIASIGVSEPGAADALVVEDTLVYETA